MSNEIDPKKKNLPSMKYAKSLNFRNPPKTFNPNLERLGAPHIDSFNYMLKDGLKAAIENLIPVEFLLPNGIEAKITIDEAAFGKPSVPSDVIGARNQRVSPTECRQRGATYRGEFKIRITVTVDGNSITLDRSLGYLPIMVKSDLCHLSNKSPEELVELNEHADEWGGYFIIKGHERLARMLVVTRRNFPVAIQRSGWKMRGNHFTDYGILTRCVTRDQTSTNNVLHFLQNGTCKFMFSCRTTMYFAPLMLIIKCLTDSTDAHIYKLLVHGKAGDHYYMNCIKNMLRELLAEQLHTPQLCRAYLGRMFRGRILELPPWATDDDAAQFLLRRCVLIHLDNYEDKVNALVYMTQKLYDFVGGKCKSEGADSVMVQEVLVGGHLYLQVLKERLQSMMGITKLNLIKYFTTDKKAAFNFGELQSIIRRSGGLDKRMETFLATGNAPSREVSLPQIKGLTIVAENINRLRYMSHFKALHRGAFFMQMRTTEARKLTGEAWGFVCPVHTPDGAPCGLLNHITMDAQITTPPDPELMAGLVQVLADCGMDDVSRVSERSFTARDVYAYPVFVDGRLAGHLPPERLQRATAYLRYLKSRGERVPPTTEIVVAPKTETAGQYPGVFLFTTEGRLMRPVINLASGQPELIGTMEQVYLHIAVTQEDFVKGVTTHAELSPTSMLSNLAQLVPMPDCNQSPRNMYQCQMAKQTMGTPIHTWPTNAGTKMYRLQTPAAPLFRPAHHDRMSLDDFPCGTNAMVAVISYTGYDMEDAMVVNKASIERGFCAGTVYKSHFVELKEVTSHFGLDPGRPELRAHIDDDGLPPVGAKLAPDDPICCFYDTETSKYVVEKFHGKEPAVVDSVRLCGDFNDKAPKKAVIMLRIERNPSVGDKFASRAGQKGILSRCWPAEDMPYTEAGVAPDILFNPHGFPSRMTIAMMIELMAGKAATLHGDVYDATPFRFHEKDTAIEHFGRLLEARGYNRHGTEQMYCGVTGVPMEVEIFYGVVHYQRLRHMVSDKWQVRTTGAVDALTRQPVKGRRRGGGVRLGEMERDALLSHGAAFVLQDRLLHCSDEATVVLCGECGTLQGPAGGSEAASRGKCRLCADGAFVTLAVPHTLKLLAAQLSAPNIKMRLDTDAHALPAA